MNCLYLALALCAALVAGTQSASVTYKDVVAEEWETFKARHSKQYNDKSEENFRLKVFMENKQRIAKHNKRAANGLHGFTLAMNEFGDLLSHEFVSVMNGFKRSYKLDSHNGSTYLSPYNVVIPAEVDWRTKGYVTEVKNQGMCAALYDDCPIS